MGRKAGNKGVHIVDLQILVLNIAMIKRRNKKYEHQYRDQIQLSRQT